MKEDIFTASQRRTPKKENVFFPLIRKKCFRHQASGELIEFVGVQKHNYLSGKDKDASN